MVDFRKPSHICVQITASVWLECSLEMVINFSELRILSPQSKVLSVYNIHTYVPKKDL